MQSPNLNKVGQQSDFAAALEHIVKERLANYKRGKKHGNIPSFVHES